VNFLGLLKESRPTETPLFWREPADCPLKPLGAKTRPSGEERAKTYLSFYIVKEKSKIGARLERKGRCKRAGCGREMTAETQGDEAA